MKTKALVLILTCTLSACSLIERHPEDGTPQPSSATEANNADPSRNTDYLEKELSRLNAKVEALETKVEVLTNGFEKQQIHNAQPAISAEAPVSTAVNPALNENIEAAPIAMAPTMMSAKSSQVVSDSKELSAQESEFRSAMELFQSGKNLEAGVAFTNFAHQNASHHLAPHALYWSGEANARAEQWRLASSNWEQLQKSYPRSAYLPEALAGLVRAYGALGDNTQAQAARSKLLRSYPQAPAALSLQQTANAVVPAAANESTRLQAARMQSKSEAAVDDPAPAAEPIPEAPFKDEAKDNPPSTEPSEEID